MKTYNFKIYGNKYAVEVGELEDNNIEVTVNGTPYKVELDMELKPGTVKPVVKVAAAPKAQAAAPAPEEEQRSIFVKSEYKLLQIDLDDIRYIEGLKDYVKIYTEQSPHPILSLMNMKAIEQMLPASRFIRVHRSFIVQKSKIREIERNRIVFGDVYIPIGDSYKQAFQDFINNK